MNTAQFKTQLSVWFNSLKQITSYRRNELFCNAKPYIFQIEATNYCNLKCPMCPHDLMTREVGFMEVELFHKLIDQVKGCLSSIRLHNMGESLFHKRFDEFISYAKSNNIKTTLSSNASALTLRNGERVLKAGLNKLIISFDGNAKDTYEYFRAGANYEKVIIKIENFLKLKRDLNKKNPKIVLQLVNMPMMKSEIKGYKQRWASQVDEIRIKPPRNWDGSSERINNLVGMEDSRQDKTPCFLLWNSLVVLWDGRVVPCCMDYDAKYVLGNIKEKSIDEIFNDEPLRKLRELHMTERVAESELCRGCNAPAGISKIKSYALSSVGRVLFKPQLSCNGAN